MSLNQIDKSFSKEDLVDQIEAYKVILQTPYGKVQSLPADLFSSGRTLKAIESSIERFVKPFGASSLGNAQIREQIKAQSKSSILKFLNCSQATHACIPFQAGRNYEYFSYICNLYINQVKKAGEGVKVNVYLQNNQSYKNVLPWLLNTERTRIITIETDKDGVIKNNSLLNTVVNHVQETSYHVIQIQSTSSKTKQILDIQDIINQVEGLKHEYPDVHFSTVLDATDIVFTKQSENAFSYFDYITISSPSLIGGQLASNLLIVRKEILNQVLESDLQHNVQELDCLQLVRMSQVLEFGNINGIQDKMYSSENSKIFYDEIQKINQGLQSTSVLTKIHLGNITSPNQAGRYSVLIFIEGGEQFIEDPGKDGHGRPILKAKLLTQMLNDFFGIQVKCNNELKTTNDFYFSDIPTHIVKQYSLTEEEGFKLLNSSTVDIDIHFLLTQEEVLYIAQALKLITQNAIKLSKYYSPQTHSLKYYIPPEYDFSLNACSQFSGNIQNFKPQKEKYDEQLQAVTKLMKSPDNYFSLQEGWSEEKSILFPLSTYEEFIPKKPKIVQSKQQIQSKLDLESTEVAVRRNSLINDEVIKTTREQILSIQKDEPKKVEVVVQKEKDPEGQNKDNKIKELEQKIKELELKQQEKLEIFEKEKQEMRNEIEKQLRVKLQIEKDYSFDVSLVKKERRNRNLVKIFNFYVNLIDVLEERKESERVVNVKQKYKKKIEEPVIEKPRTMAINKFFKFCSDFELINQELDLKTLYSLFHKISSIHGEIQFSEFQILLEKMAQIYYDKSEKLFNQFDRIEQFYRHIGLDDFRLFKDKMKIEGLANFSFIFHDKYKLYNQGHVIPNNPQFASYNPRLFESSNTPLSSNSNLKGLSKKDEFDWNTDSVSVNAKQILNDRYISQDELFTEIAMLSKSEEPVRNSSSLQPQSRVQNSSQIFATPGVKGKQSLQYVSSNNGGIPKVTPKQQSPSSPSSKQQEYSKMLNNKSYINVQQNQYSTPQYGNASKKQDFQESNFYSDSNYQADYRKQQLLQRAKQIADLEKEKEIYRIKSLGSESSPNINSQLKYGSPKQQEYQNSYLFQGYKNNNNNNNNNINRNQMVQQQAYPHPLSNSHDQQQMLKIYKQYGTQKR